MVLLLNREKSILLVHLRLGESVGQNLLAQHPRDIRWWSSIAGDASGSEIAVRFKRISNRRLRDDLQFRTIWRIADQQIHRTDKLLRLDTQVALDFAIVLSFHAWNLNSALTILESLSDVLELLVRERWTEHSRALTVDRESTEVDGTGHSAENPQRLAFPLHFRDRCNVDGIQPLLGRLCKKERERCQYGITNYCPFYNQSTNR